MTGEPAPLLARLGGRAGIEDIVRAFYEHVERDPKLRPMFPDDMAESRQRQALFLEQWLGGEERYSALHGPPQMRRRHLPFAITEDLADRWLAAMAAALRDAGTPEDAAGEFLAALAPVARHMVNTLPPEALRRVGNAEG